jgi:hypothetical protein
MRASVINVSDGLRNRVSRLNPRSVLTPAELTCNGVSVDRLLRGQHLNGDCAQARPDTFPRPSEFDCRMPGKKNPRSRPLRGLCFCFQLTA